MSATRISCLFAVAAFAAHLPAAAAPNQTCDIDFEGLPAGTILTELSVGAGISNCSVAGTVSVEARNSIFSSEAGITFDSACPVIADPPSDCNAADRDLGTPHEDFGGPGTGDGGAAGSPYQNDTPLGMIGVLAKDKVDVNADDLVDDPDDADVPGTWTFDFTGIRNNGVGIESVTLMDVELAENENPAEVTLIRPGNPPAVFTHVDTGDGGVATIELIGLTGVTEVQVDFKGSSGLAAIQFSEREVTGGACWATFGGFHSAFVGPEDDKIASFGGNVGPPPSGHLNIVKHATGEHLRVFDVEVESCERDEQVCASSGDRSPGQPGGKKGFDVNVLNFVGVGFLDGEEVPVSGRLVDCGEPQGKKELDPDRFEIFANGALFVGDALGGGNIQLHPPNPSLE